MNSMHVKIDKDKCFGCNICTTICPQVFKVDKDKSAIVAYDSIPKQFVDKCIEAADSCPSDAIRITPPNIWED